MFNRNHLAVLAVSLFASASLWAQASPSSVSKELKALAAAPAAPGVGGNAMPDAQRPAAVLQAAKDIESLPAGNAKVKFADQLAHIAGQRDPGHEGVQAAGDALTQSLTETPQPADKDGQPAEPYIMLAKLVRYAGVTTTLKDPTFEKAGQILIADDTDAQKADFTLKGMDGKKVSMSSLRGKIVLVYFWSTMCPACVGEMQDLDLIYTHYQSQGLVILSITGDNPFRAGTFLNGKNYHPAVLFDDKQVAAKQFHVNEFVVDDLPRTFVFNRDGKLVGESLGSSTQQQLFQMLGAAGLKPQ